jgi:hypothetical protein
MTALRERTEALERQLAEIERITQARLVLAELKTEALRAGMIDLDGLKLLDLSGAKLNEQGNVEGAAALVAELKRTKSWLFGRSSSSGANPPPAQPPRQKLATEMNDEEYRAARAALVKRRG